AVVQYRRQLFRPVFGHGSPLSSLYPARLRYSLVSTSAPVQAGDVYLCADSLLAVAVLASCQRNAAAGGRRHATPACARNLRYCTESSTLPPRCEDAPPPTVNEGSLHKPHGS